MICLQNLIHRSTYLCKMMDLIKVFMQIYDQIEQTVNTVLNMFNLMYKEICLIHQQNQLEEKAIFLPKSYNTNIIPQQLQF